MKIYDAGKIFTGLALFIVFLTAPIWLSGGKSASPPDIKVDTPVIQKLSEKRCLEPTAYMKANHMELLGTWRRAVVRGGESVYVASDGKKYRMSLSSTCLYCHSNKDQFCDRCHNYEGVKPACWSCHVVPQELKG
jgi:hypothetical protein